MIKQSIELCVLLKQDRILIIEYGHQPFSATIQKIENSGVLKIIQETKFLLKCKKTYKRFKKCPIGKKTKNRNLLNFVHLHLMNNFTEIFRCHIFPAFKKLIEIR